MEPVPKYYKQQFYLFTQKQNKISKSIILKGAEHIRMEGKDVIHSAVLIRGDMAPFHLGQYVIIKENVILRPTFNKKHGKLQYIQMEIGDNVYIDEKCVISAASIGSNVHIGKNCIIGHRVVIKDNTKILDDSVLAADTIVPPFTVFGGKPALYLGELTESMAQINADLCKTYYRNFIGVGPNQTAPGQGGGQAQQPQ